MIDENAKRLTPEQEAANEWVEQEGTSQSVGTVDGSYLWYGWSLRDAFIAGARWQKEQSKNARARLRGV